MRSVSLVQKVFDLLECRRIPEAIVASDEAIENGTDPLDLVYARWMCFMLLGDCGRAWAESDRVLSAHPPWADAHLPRHLQRVWNGQPFDGKRVLVRCYHGLGDTIQFSRFLPDLKRHASDVIVQCEPALVPLLASLVDERKIVLLDCQPEPDVDCEIEIMELAYAFRTTIGTIPANAPYVAIEPRTTEKICSRRCVEGPKVGLVWSTGNWNPARNVGLHNFAPLGNLSGVAFYCLQHANTAGEFNGLRAAIQFENSGPIHTPLIETAALISQLDLVISVDTMVAHLAGALGKPTWLLLPFSADWRWMLERNDSPWYPTMRLFRQARPGDWEPVIRNVMQELSRFGAA